MTFEMKIALIIAVAAAAGSDVSPSNNFILYGTLGVVVTTLSFADQWLTPKGVKPYVFLSHLSAVPVLSMLTLAICEYYALNSFAAAVVGVGVALLGVGPFKQLAELAYHLFRKKIDPEIPQAMVLRNDDNDHPQG